jgi:hypothetical protein
MAEERDDQEFGGIEGKSQQSTGQQGQQPTGQQQGQQQTMSGQGGSQSIGGNDSETGSGTPQSQGSDFGGQSSSGQAQSSPGSGDTMTQSRGNSDQSAFDQAPGSSSGSKGEGFIGSNANDSTDFADQGQGALDKQSNPTSQANREDSDSEGQDDSSSI